MNAMEARNMSNSNLPRLVETNVLAAKTLMKQQITSAAKKGEFAARLPIVLPFTIQDEVINQLVSYYQKLGYEVNVHSLLTTKSISVSWSEEK